VGHYPFTFKKKGVQLNCPGEPLSEAAHTAARLAAKHHHTKWLAREKRKAREKESK
jgi:hypothetical protein